jgi:hypothetical protein
MNKTRTLFGFLRHDNVALSWLVAVVCVGGLVSTSALNSQPSVMIQNGKTFMAGEMTVGADIPPIETQAFTCTTIQPIKKGDKVAGYFEVGQAGQNKLWSVATHAFEVGANQVAYPIMAIVPSSDGAGHSLIAAILQAKTGIAAGSSLRADGYQIETERAVAAGESIPALYVIGQNTIALLSIAASGERKSVFAAFADGMGSGVRASFIETWQLENDHVAHWIEPVKVPK